MSKSARSLFVFAIYLIFLGGILMVTPNTLMNLFGYPATSEVWIRVLGMLLFFLAIYYIHAVRNELAGFFQLTVYVRGSVILFITAFVAFGFAEPILLVFGVVDLAAALWTHTALRLS